MVRAMLTWRNVPQSNVRAQIAWGHGGCPRVPHVDVKAMEENKPTINERSCIGQLDKKGSVCVCNVIQWIWYERDLLACSTLILLAENVRWVNRFCTNYLCPQLTMSSGMRHERNVFLISAFNCYLKKKEKKDVQWSLCWALCLLIRFVDFILFGSRGCASRNKFLLFKFPIDQKELHRSEKIKNKKVTWEWKKNVHSAVIVVLDF